MPNRVIKDSIKRSSEIDALTWFQEVCFYRLMTTVDDNGCYHANPQILRSDLFPLKEDITKASVSDALDRLESVGLLKRYDVEGKPYLALTTWGKHQRIRNKTHHFPEPPWMTGTDCSGSQQNRNDCGNSRRIAADCSDTKNVAADHAANRGEARPESKNPRIQESKKKNPEEDDLAADGLKAIQKIHNEIFDEAERIGLPNTQYNREALVDLYVCTSYEAVMNGLSEAGRLNKVSLAYIKAVATNYGKPKPKDDDGRIDDDFLETCW